MCRSALFALYCRQPPKKRSFLEPRPSQGAERIEISDRRVASYTTRDAKEIAKLLAMVP